jgi:DNA-binding PucR family transcriptional regulator
LCVFVPDPSGPGRRRALGTALQGARAALGPAVPWPRASASLRRAASALALPQDGLIVAEDHLATLLLAADPALGAELAAARLAPLEVLTDSQRERMETTLRAWLDRPGQVQAVAAALGVHPQTVRYRMTRLRELFGERLEDPEARFELGLALRLTPMR